MTAAARSTGKSTSSVFLIERRMTLPRINTIEDYAMAFGVSPSWLAYGEGPEDAVQAESTASGLGQRLVEARKAKGLSRQALGNAAGLTGQTVANIEVHGMMPRVDTVEMLARVLDVTAGWLAFRSTKVQYSISLEPSRTSQDPSSTDHEARADWRLTSAGHLRSIGKSMQEKGTRTAKPEV